MKNYNYTADVHYVIGKHYLTDSFQQLPKATEKLKLKERRVLLVTEKMYFGFYKDELASVFGSISKSFDVFEIESTPTDYPAEKEKLASFAKEIGFDSSDCLVSLGGFPADTLSRIFLAEGFETAMYLQIPVTFTAQLVSGKGASYVLEVSPSVYGDAKERALSIEPKLIYINVHSYKYLSNDERISGLGEAIRCAVSSDKALLNLIETNAGQKTDNFSAFLMTLIANCIQDEEKKADTNTHDALFGYTIARGLEKCTNYIIPHGSAVSIGMVVANSIASKRGLLSNDDNFRIARVMVSYGLPVSMNFTNELIEAICASVKAIPELVDENGTLGAFVMADKIGHTKKFDNVTIEEIMDVMNYRKISR